MIDICKQLDFNFDTLSVQQYLLCEIFLVWSLNVIICLIVDWNIRMWC